jgi:hypothetical protein
LGEQAVPSVVSIGLTVIGALSIFLYVKHARRSAAPILDMSLFRYRTFKPNFTRFLG